MSKPIGTATDDLTLCMVVHTRSGNLANALHSVSQLTDQMVVVDAGGGGEQAVQHLALEYDAIYLQASADPDEGALINTALDRVATPWALFMHQEEVLQVQQPHTIFSYLSNTERIAFDLPIIPSHEPSNRYFETRLIRTDREIRWEHTISPTLTASLERAAEQARLTHPVTVMPQAAVITLGESEHEEWELKDAIIRLEKELDQDPWSIRYWYLLAKTASALRERDRVQSAVKEGLNIVGKRPDTARQEPHAVNGLLGLFCEDLLACNDYPEKTIESLWTIYTNMEGDGRFSLPFSNLLIAVNREEDAADIQYQAARNFYSKRRYYLSIEDGLFKPLLRAWEIEARSSSSDLLDSIIKVQTLLDNHQNDMQALLHYTYNHNKHLFAAIQGLLLDSLKHHGR